VSTKSEEAFQPQLDTKTELRVVDFFCGAGGFSEGFRQQGFKIIKGIDHWAPAVKSHNINHDLNDEPQDVLDFWSYHDLPHAKGLKEIESLLDSEIILGSPPCVSFSMSNNAGKADKRLGVKLIESFLRVIAVKRNKPGSALKAWYMENVPKSQHSIEASYTFRDLNLATWAQQFDIDPDKVALTTNGKSLNSADYGSPQKRERWVCGEVKKGDEWIGYSEPAKSHGKAGTTVLPRYKSLGMIKSSMPAPTQFRESATAIDPNYPSLTVPHKHLTDHFYDTGLYEIQWRKAEDLKRNHPYMGVMSFPENEDNTSRTILATRSPSSREALIYRSEFARKGNGEFRLPTIREVATLMGFPYVYQFYGSENSKWRQIGNAVCPHLSAALARALRVHLNLSPIAVEELDFKSLHSHPVTETNLNDGCQEKIFDAKLVRQSGSRFRMHPFKDGNMTVALTNFNARNKSNSKPHGTKWYAYAFFGTGNEFVPYSINGKDFPKLRRLVAKECGEDLIQKFTSQLIPHVGTFSQLQMQHEQNSPEGSLYTPQQIVGKVKALAEEYDPHKKIIDISEYGLPVPKKKLPLRQLIAMYAFDYLTDVAEQRSLAL
jgi:DNA (cytosine-5)-methyltransferase 1